MGAIVGMVTDEDEPVEGQNVHASKGVDTYSAVTDEYGFCSFPELTPGDYTVCLLDEFLVVIPDTCIDVTVVGGEIATVSFAL